MRGTNKQPNRQKTILKRKRENKVKEKMKENLNEPVLKIYFSDRQVDAVD